MILPADDAPLPNSSDGPRFKPGGLVKHKRYGYRGVVVAADRECKAPDDWYSSNKTQPERKQAWYHVLVDGSVAVTYAAESSLMADPLGSQVRNPLVAEFFSDFVSHEYVRNSMPWPGWESDA